MSAMGQECWQGSYQPEVCCNAWYGPQGLESCWDGPYNFQTCCAQGLASVGAVARGFSDWTRGETVDNIAGVPEVALRVCMAAMSAPESAWQLVRYTAVQDVGGGRAASFAGLFRVPTACAAEVISRVLAPLDLRRRGVVRDDIYILMQGVSFSPEVAVEWWRFAYLAPFVWLAPCVPMTSGARQPRDRHVTADILRIAAAATVLALHVRRGLTFREVAPWEQSWLHFLGQHVSHALFLATSAMLLEESSDRPRWRQRLPRALGSRIWRLCVVSVLTTILVVTVASHRAQSGVGIFDVGGGTMISGILMSHWKVTVSPALNMLEEGGILGDMADWASSMVQGQPWMERDDTKHPRLGNVRPFTYFFFMEMTSWTITSAALAMPCSRFASLPALALAGAIFDRHRLHEGAGQKMFHPFVLSALTSAVMRRALGGHRLGVIALVAGTSALVGAACLLNNVGAREFTHPPLIVAGAHFWGLRLGTYSGRPWLRPLAWLADLSVGTLVTHWVALIVIESYAEEPFEASPRALARLSAGVTVIFVFTGWLAQHLVFLPAAWYYKRLCDALAAGFSRAARKAPGFAASEAAVSNGHRTKAE